MHIVQFFELEDLIEDLDCDYSTDDTEVVRVQTMGFTASQFKDVLVRNEAIGVDIRAVNKPRDAILACFIPTGVVQIRGPKKTPESGDPEYEEWQKAWDEARALKERVVQRLDEDSWWVRKGVIEIGDTKRIYGQWKGDPANGEK